MPDFSDILLTVDYDRTLTAPDSTIPERNIEAIRYFMENGGAFTVNTGRSLPMARPFIGKVPVNAPLLLYNGSGAYDLNTQEMGLLYEIPLDQSQVIRRCMELFPDLTVEVQTFDAHYRFTENPAWDAFSDHGGCARGEANPEDDLGPFLKFTLYGEIRDVTVASFYEATPEEMARMDAAQALLEQEFGEHVAVFRAAARILDMHAKGVSKNRAARALQERLGRKILVCVGDGENDVSMLQGADYAYCPADAVVADRFENVCVCAEGAVADVIYKKIPEILERNP